VARVVGLAARRRRAAGERHRADLALRALAGLGIDLADEGIDDVGVEPSSLLENRSVSDERLGRIDEALAGYHRARAIAEARGSARPSR
jgi:hypothetical protein